MLIKVDGQYPSQRTAPDWNNPKAHKTWEYQKAATDEYRTNYGQIFGKKKSGK